MQLPAPFQSRATRSATWRYSRLPPDSRSWKSRAPGFEVRHRMITPRSCHLQVRLDRIESQVGIHRDRIGAVALEGLLRVLRGRAADVAALGIQDHRQPGMLLVDVVDGAPAAGLPRPARRSARTAACSSRRRSRGGVDDLPVELEDRLRASRADAAGNRSSSGSSPTHTSESLRCRRRVQPRRRMPVPQSRMPVPRFSSTSAQVNSTTTSTIMMAKAPGTLTSLVPRKP